MSNLSIFARWDVVALLAAMFVLLGLEMLGVFGGRPYLTITFVLRSYVPKWALAMAWGWLGWHFLFSK